VSASANEKRVPGWAVLAVLVVLIGVLIWTIWNGPRR